MRDVIAASGMVLSAMPIGEYDKRVVLLTKQLGRITAFARGARRQNSPLLASTRPFVLGTFSLFPGRNSYSLQSAEVTEYFDQLGTDLEAVSYACYFAELAEYYTRENVDESQMLNLLYVSIKALLAGWVPRPLVRRIFEMRAMVINGEYPQIFTCMKCGEEPQEGIYSKTRKGILCPRCQKTREGELFLGQAALQALRYAAAAPLQRLYRFTLKEDAFREMEQVVSAGLSAFVDKKFHSLKVLEALQNEKNPVK